MHKKSKKEILQNVSICFKQCELMTVFSGFAPLKMKGWVRMGGVEWSSGDEGSTHYIID